MFILGFINKLEYSLSRIFLNYVKDEFKLYEIVIFVKDGLILVILCGLVK